MQQNEETASVTNVEPGGPDIPEEQMKDVEMERKRRKARIAKILTEAPSPATKQQAQGRWGNIHYWGRGMDISNNF